MPDLFPGQDPIALTARLSVTSQVVTAYSRHLPGSVVTNLGIGQSLDASIEANPFNSKVASTVTVGQTIVVQRVKVVVSAITISQIIAPHIDRSISLTDSVPIDQSLSAWIDKGTSGNSAGVFVDPGIAAEVAALTPPALITFDCSSAGQTITLRKPQFGDAEIYEEFRVQRNTPGGDLQIYKDRMWPATESIEVSFEYLSEEDATNLLIFLAGTLGKKMTFSDHFGRSLEGFITTPFERILQPKVKGWSASFTFQRFNSPNPKT